MNEESTQGFGVYSAGGEVKLAMQDLLLTGTVLPVGARLVVRHTFQSAEQKPLEVVYAFALPRDAALRRFRITGEGFEAQSELRKLEKAREAYEKGIERGHLSTLAQTYQDGLVNLNVGNIRPGETVTVYLEIVAGVETHDDGFRFRFPFTLAPGYHARASYAEVAPGVGEASLPEDIFGDVVLPRWQADAKNLHRVSFDLSVALPCGGAELLCPSHPVSVRPDDAGQARVRLATANDRPNRDVIIETRGAAAAPLVLAGVDDAGRGRFAVVAPSPGFGAAKDAPRRVVFLVDHSGSMEGAPLDQAKRAVLACLEALDRRDHFGIVFFESGVTSFKMELVPATEEHLEGARNFVKAVQAAGGTELAGGVDAAARLLGQGGEMLLLTDGEVFGTDEILARIRKTGATVHCLGIGSASQDRTLALIARASGGVSTFLSPRERIELAVLDLFKAVGRRLAVDLRCAAEGLQEVEWLPEPLTEVREGQPWLLFGACGGGGEGVLRLAWDAGDREIPVHVTPSPLGETLKLLQGARLITDLDSESGGEFGALIKRRQGRVEKRLEKLGAEYGLANRAMALVSVVKRAGDQPGALPVTQVVPVGMPEDTEFNSYFDVQHMSSMACRMPNIMVEDACLAVDPEAVSEFELCTCDMVMEKYCQSAHPLPRSMDDGKHLVKQAGELARFLDGQGGILGGSREERVVFSLAALLLLLKADSPGKGGAFTAHITALSEFLEREGLPAPEQAPQGMLEGLLRELRLHPGHSALCAGVDRPFAETLSGQLELWEQTATGSPIRLAMLRELGEALAGVYGHYRPLEKTL